MFKPRYRNDQRPTAGTALDVKRLRTNVAGNCAVKVQIACQISGGALCESGIDIKTITRSVVMILNVDLCLCWQNCTPQTCNNKRRNGK